MTTAVPWVAHGTHPLCFHRKGGRGSVGDFSRLYLCQYIEKDEQFSRLDSSGNCQ